MPRRSDRRRRLRPGGSEWVFSLVESSILALGKLMRRRHGEYLVRLRDEAYRVQVFAYGEKEDISDRCCSNSTSCDRSGSRRSKSYTRTAAFPPSALWKDEVAASVALADR